METVQNEINRLNFEDWIFIFFIVASLLNIYGDNLLKKYLTKNDIEDKEKADEVFTIVIIISIFLYLYFVKRNFKFYIEGEEQEKNVLSIKLIGSLLLLAGAILLLIFQLKDSDIIAPPSV